ncbi:ZYBA0S03-05006g1_1 [Zygosaccharomyces bailii CLIB 213]|uniref:ZYBA0S03-05006g1_1 n=1 Tax=Zygosaccharomyces bailii (strain CLIB 213 / ATCC 58445 / CBS 680 / BCRC 21525 / NBRC 1098 / NCYC 1416 / NRRL Y-2227) TaxID=1333698 RepID=A0A8J2T5V9_ZYGB2|nr:ZYBA0S03-05006g1_1 [Zygosaccharomyces bailii CLIB 213]
MSEIVSKFKSLSIEEPTLSKEQQALAAQWESVLKTGRTQELLDELNLQLRDNTFVLATYQPTLIDVHLFEVVLPLLKELIFSSKDVKSTYAKYRHVLRWLDYLQCLLQVPEDDQIKVNYDIDLPREVIEKKKKTDNGSKASSKPTSADTGAAEQKKTGKGTKPRGKPDEETLKKLREEAKAKKEAKKAAKQPQQAQAPVKPKPSAIDLRVGFIQKAIKHPDADSLYVSTIDCGDADGPRTVCSGLVKYVKLEDMQQRYVVVVCNLKPANMRGIKSQAMVLCGSTEGAVELAQPPADSQAGDKLFFEGYQEEGPKSQLNPKKKIWEQIQPHFITTADCEIAYKDEDDTEKPLKMLVNSKGETFKVATLANAHVS